VSHDSQAVSRVLGELRSMPEFLRAAAARFPGQAVLVGGPAGGFCFLEQVWHLADLEREGYGLRIERILREDDPSLEDFDGDHVARERDYRSLSLSEGLARFASARERNIEVLGGLAPHQWERTASQEGVGPISLFDVPRMMAEHDASHRAEIRGLLGEAPSEPQDSRLARRA
jgi:DinB superfamily